MATPCAIFDNYLADRRDVLLVKSATRNCRPALPIAVADRESVVSLHVRRLVGKCAMSRPAMYGRRALRASVLLMVIGLLQAQASGSVQASQRGQTRLPAFAAPFGFAAATKVRAAEPSVGSSSEAAPLVARPKQQLPAFPDSPNDLVGDVVGSIVDTLRAGRQRRLRVDLFANELNGISEGWSALVSRGYMPLYEEVRWSSAAIVYCVMCRVARWRQGAGAVDLLWSVGCSCEAMAGASWGAVI